MSSSVLRILERSRGNLVCVFFVDGDSYHIDDIEICMDEETTELYVRFAKCLAQSSALEQAMASHTKIVGVWYANEGCGPPIGRTYFLEDIQRVTDPLKGYDLYTAQAE